MNPGRLSICLGCASHDQMMSGQGHPHPCLQVRWQDHKHLGPDMRVDGETITCLSRVERVEGTA